MNLCSSFNPSELYKEVLETMPSCTSIQDLLDKFYVKYDLPLILCDVAYNVIAYSGPYPCEDPYWNVQVELGYSPSDLIARYYEVGYMNSAANTQGPFFIDWGDSADYPQWCCGIFVQGVLQAFLGVLFMTDDKKEFSLALISALHHAVEFLLERSSGNLFSDNAQEQTLLARRLFDDPTAPVLSLNDELLEQAVKNESGYLVVVLELDEPMHGKIQTIRAAIRRNWSQMVYLNKDNLLYCIFFGVRNKETRNRVLDIIRHEAQNKVKYSCGISNYFFDLDSRAEFIQQAELALKYGPTIYPPNSSEFFWNKLYSEIVLSEGYSNLLSGNLMLPELLVLKEYDCSHNTELYDSLKAYLFCFCDMSAAAIRLCIHRNSLTYRINKCEELIGCTPSSEQNFRRFYLCYQIQELLK